MKKYTLLGNPIPLARPRFGKHVYDAQRVEKANAQAQLIEQHLFLPPFSGSLLLKVSFFMPIPKGQPKKRPLSGLFHAIRPDLSNLIKFVEDVSVGVLFHDDALISSIHAQKIYDKNPRTEFEIIPIVIRERND